MNFLNENMPVFTIVGWYGTETMGDRAILDGIFSIFSSIFNEYKIQICSLFPFYTQRTLYEERKLLERKCPINNIRIIEMKDRAAREDAIIHSDFVIMGGGPLMEIREICLINDCFHLANKRNIRTIILGCGFGPIRSSYYRDMMKELFDYSDLIILRDRESEKEVNTIYNNNYNVKYIGDPAVISIEEYKCEKIDDRKDRSNYIAINLREYPQSEYGGDCSITINEYREVIKHIAEHGYKIKLVPMHSFFVGGDDRAFFSKIVLDLEEEHVKVIHKPYNLEELYECYMNATWCIGMRYHSVVMQSILNGNNFIIDYTNPLNGKIMGFIKSLHAETFYKGRMIHLQNGEGIDYLNEWLKISESGESYMYQISETKKKYQNELVNFMM